MVSLVESAAISLTTERLTLREFDYADWEELFDYWRFESFYRFRAVPIPTPEYVQSCIEQYLLDRNAQPRWNYWLAICHSHTPARCIGLISLRTLQGAPRSAEIGYSLHHTETGRGYATEAASRIMEFGATELGMQRFIARVAEQNYPSRRILEKLGFIFRDKIANPKPIRGQILPAMLFERNITVRQASHGTSTCHR
jgi:ribosomal-protein-alanine N-acetyltransferase